MANAQTKIIKYATLPQVLPRLYQLFATGFAHVPFFMALIYQAARLLPADHPYLNPKNIGRYGIRHVVAQAANNLKLDKKHIDQTLIFFIILCGVVLLLAQVILFGIAIFSQHQVFAMSPTDLISVNSQYNKGPNQDIAFILLDRVFGMKGIFQSCVSVSHVAGDANAGPPCADLQGNPLPDSGAAFPTPFQLALHTLLNFYSLGIFFIAALLIVYFIIAITAETAATGIPFGQRFNKTWAPVRLVVFAALLLPLNIGGDNAGLNGGQIITLWSAKLGSNFATNAWGRFNKVLVQGYLGDTMNLIATPNAPEINQLAQFLFTAKTCQIAENYAYGHGGNGIQAYLVRSKPANGSASSGVDYLDMRATDYDAAVKFANYGPIHIRFGEQNDAFKDYSGGVQPFCGEVRDDVLGADQAGGAKSGATSIQELYYNLVRKMWDDSTMVTYAKCVRNRIVQYEHDPNCAEWPDQQFQKNIISSFQTYINQSLPGFINTEKQSSDWGVPEDLLKKGWAGAGIWYNRIAKMNGDVANAVENVPQSTTFPYVMEVVSRAQHMNNQNITAATVFDPVTADGSTIKYPRDRDLEIAEVENEAWSSWNASGAYGSHINKGSDVVSGVIGAFFGANGIYDMRNNTNVHPLAQLSSLGKSMMQAAIRNYTIGTGLSIFGNFGNDQLSQLLGSLASTGGSIVSSVGTVFFIISFMLYYVIPFLPFLYFFFAVSGWVKAIFEAMVAIPLWALAHIRIDGEGMPGPSANNGYFLILEIFLRPIFIVFGLLASIQIFTAMVTVLNQIFDLVTQNVSGFDQSAEFSATIANTKLSFARGPLDQLFYTITYVVICYITGLSCFKLIDQIPNNVLRWMGLSLKSFAEDANEDAGELTSRAYEGAQLATEKLQGGQIGALAAISGR